MTDLVRLLRYFGLNVQDERVAPRPGSFAPIGVLNHHTAISGPGLTVCKNGRRDLPGPLCNINITRQGVINVVCDGRANHAGKGSSVVAGDVRAGRPITQDARDRHLTDDTDGNTRFYGIEVDNDGVGEPLTGVQQDALIGVNAALVAHFGWDPNCCIHHRQWTARKTDMRWRGDIPALVRFRLSPSPEDDLMRYPDHGYLPVIIEANGKGRSEVPVPFDKVTSVSLKANDDGTLPKAALGFTANPYDLGKTVVSAEGHPGTVGVVLGVTR